MQVTSKPPLFFMHQAPNYEVVEIRTEPSITETLQTSPLLKDSVQSVVEVKKFTSTLVNSY